MTSSVAHPTNSLSRFHRSMSMGQGWPSGSSSGAKYIPQMVAENSGAHQSKVVLRRRNNSTCDGL